MSTRLHLDLECVSTADHDRRVAGVVGARGRAVLGRIPAGKVFRWRPGMDEPDVWQLPAAVGSIGLRERDGLVAAMRSGIHLFDLATGALTFCTTRSPT